MRLLLLPRNALRFLRLSRQERSDLISAFWAILHARRLMRARPLGDLVAVTDDSAPTLQVDRPTARRIGTAVNTVARNVPFDAACLVRSLAVQRMLRDRGFDPGQIKIGVDWDGKEFLAHAWVEQGERIVGDSREHVARYTQVTDVTSVKF